MLNLGETIHSMTPQFLSRRQFLGKASAAAILTKQLSLSKLTGESNAGENGDSKGTDEKLIEEKSIWGHGDFKYRAVKDWGKLDPKETPVMNCHEMVIDSKGRILMLTDDVHNNIIVYSKDGTLLETWGSRWPGGHGLSLSKEGDEEFLFIVDCGWYFGKDGKEVWNRQSGTVTKTTLDGEVVFTIGHPQTIGIYDEGQTFMPTEVAVAPNGDFYVADGYGSDFVLQYDRRGRYIRKFGGHDNSDKKHNLHNAHGIATDLRDPENPVLICTSRNENCFKRFTMDGRYLDTIPLPGAYPCRPVIAGENLYAAISWSNEEGVGPRLDDSGFVVVLDKENRVVSAPGGIEPVYENDELKPLYQDGDLFRHCHDVCVDDDENLYVCQWNSGKTYPIKLERIKPKVEES
ncbi:hypothetical protein MLD52_15590 [Puniceicoccaceae bacterium K14]|nr:hypothetical protein [Puniceicoccaceae bacterium K14]